MVGSQIHLFSVCTEVYMAPIFYKAVCMYPVCSKEVCMSSVCYMEVYISPRGYKEVYMCPMCFMEVCMCSVTVERHLHRQKFFHKGRSLHSLTSVALK